MPTIRKKGEGQYHVQIRKRGYPTQTKTFTKEADARRWATIIESEMERGVFVSRTEAEATLVKDVLERFATEVLPTKRSEQSDKSRIKTLAEAFGDYRLASLNSTQVARFRDQRLKVVGPQSVIHEINLLNRVLKTATMDWGIALPGGLPTAQVRKPIKPRGRDRRVTEEEITKILESTGSDELRTIVTLAVETGMRRSELASLTWDEVDLKKQTAHLPKTKTDVPRTVPLSTTAVKSLKNFGAKIEGRVFILQAESMSQAFERACKPHRANISGLRFHDLRHEATSRLFEKGLNVMEVAAITGHKTLDMLKRYTHLRAEDLAKKMG
ncbi:tyrosine-type recombinase/integrase [Janthinobacterium rivuli]|uniref:site-specific integrase n=1 Tax=Janthinobacterium sp. FT68W TaxID=2654255 RepID=UPI0012640017|nr:site-specific integrase [Janthinobacterium sp. FT68W]KAB8052210.1 tyrosine-type recombinase/integrase [Janthinobacterium sp. FT68W]